MRNLHKTLKLFVQLISLLWFLHLQGLDLGYILRRGPTKDFCTTLPFTISHHSKPFYVCEFKRDDLQAFPHTLP
jgi:hypothetical protein